MWPLCFLLNKLLKIEEGEASASARHQAVSVVECCPSDHSSDGIFQGAGLPCSNFVEVPHIKQLASWDCGLACVLMALRATGVDSCSLEELAALCCTTSIWTVDLAYLLQKFSIKFSYFTITVGANPNYSIETFYKEQLPTDLLRVDTLFREAPEIGINIQCRSISTDEISRLILSGNYIAIALVDQYKLSDSWVEEVIISGFHGNNYGYAGHYVVICGYDAATDKFEIRDPASPRDHDIISSTCLEKARKSFGTDEDLLLISVEKSERSRGPWTHFLNTNHLS